ncbi:MAG: DUF4390 domain-containing protein [Gammaproteobacteria bacterium]|nr:DUF4390 domain-containing protein [Gammaproteobacteria bacterium]
MKDDFSKKMQKRRRAHVLGLFVFLLCWFVPIAVPAADDAVVVESAATHLNGGVYELNAMVRMTLPVKVVDALESGVPIVFELQLKVGQGRWYWLDKMIVEKSQRYRLYYHAFTRQYLLKDLNSGIQRNYLTLQDAITGFTSISNYPLLDAEALKPDTYYEAQLRLLLDRKLLPAALRANALLDSNWYVQSDWFAWGVTE